MFFKMERIYSVSTPAIRSSRGRALLHILNIKRDQTYCLAKRKMWFAFMVRVRHELHNKLCYLLLNPSCKL
jgi:hypothetical protein